MSAFEHVSVLLSFIFALALTHLLSRIATLILERDRVRFSGLLSLAMFNAIQVVFGNWIELWDMRTKQDWSLASILLIFLFSTVLYLLCAVCAPERAEHGEIDMEAFYWKNRRLYYGAFLLLIPLSMTVNADYLGTRSAGLFVQESLGALLFLVPALLGFSVRARWAQWTSLITMCGMFAVFNAMFSKVMS